MMHKAAALFMLCLVCNVSYGQLNSSSAPIGSMNEAEPKGSNESIRGDDVKTLQEGHRLLLL